MRDAINRGDWAGFIDCCGKDPVVDDWGDVYAGIDAIKTWSDRELIGAKGTLTITRVLSSTPEAVVFDTEWTSNFLTGPGRFTVTIIDGRIRHLRIGES